MSRKLITLKKINVTPGSTPTRVVATRKFRRAVFRKAQPTPSVQFAARAEVRAVGRKISKQHHELLEWLKDS